MPERIPKGVPIHSWVDRLVHEAQERGEFDNLSGAGKPLKGLDRPYDENWWINQKIEEEEVPSSAVLPPALQLRKEVRGLPEAVRDLPDEASVRAMVAEVNERVAQWIRAPKGPVFPVGPARVQDVVDGWQAHRATLAEQEPPEPDPSPKHPDDDGTSATKKPRRRRWWPW